ncbi:hypothetical protein RHIZ404_190428 [Rhizobium sp. EC-SD404]|nr:hypothetical protein RHIZ404_190428 [Rhizobium sp. EC-SD404]
MAMEMIGQGVRTGSAAKAPDPDERTLRPDQYPRGQEAT